MFSKQKPPSDQKTTPAQFTGSRSGTNPNEPGPLPGHIPQISFPKGGGTMSGMGEKFNVNPATGTGAMSVPITTSPARGIQPDLSLNYNSGQGNSAFGLGWTLSTPRIARKTDKGIPQYRDSEESDVFLLTNAEDLVPTFKRNQDGSFVKDKETGNPMVEEEVRDGYVIRRYSPRVEDSYTRIERWQRVAGTQGNIHWRTITPNNVTSLYGVDDNSRIYDPSLDGDLRHIFAWLISETYDMKGNAMLYEYKAENSNGVCTEQAHESNRTDKIRSSNRYLKTIKYGNRTPNRYQSSWKAFSAFSLPKEDWMFTLLFDYGEHSSDFTNLKEETQWPCRKDAFSSYRSGFEIRTYRLCRRLLMFHHFPDQLARPDYLVSALDLSYDETSSITYLTGVTHVGYMLDEASNRYLSKPLPTLEFEYSRFPSDDELSRLKVQDIDTQSLENIPYGVDGSNYQWVDLNGEGLSGILTEQATAWHYKRNLSANNLDHSTHIPVVKLEAMQTVMPKPSLTDGQPFFSDVEGDGLMDLVRMDTFMSGFHSRKFDIGEAVGWHPFHTFNSIPNLSWNNPDLRFIDLTGDGLPDILITEEHVFRWYPGLGKKGYGQESRSPQSLDEKKGPMLVFADPEQSIYLADMSGDGLTDLARVRNGQVCYWPNTGYGTFGAMVMMDGSPWFAAYDQFNQRYVHMADIDGSGTSDIFYISPDGIDIYLNKAGNAFSSAKQLSLLPSPNAFSTVQAVDLLGTGTSCLVWSSALPGLSTSMKYIDLTNGNKPHLLVGTVNNLGAQTRIHYAPSTKFYLNDKETAKQWITLLPFPVQCVEKVEIFDDVSHNRFVNRYAYHHGFYDGYDREFRGFGMVEQWDSEEFPVMSQESSFHKIGSNIDSTWHVPPAYTKTWLHTGVFRHDGNISRYLAHEYFGAPPADCVEDDEKFLNTILDDSSIQDGLGIDVAAREQCRALAGHVLRTEVYANDNSDKAEIPYIITESNYTVRVLQKHHDIHRHSIVAVNPRETISHNLERNLHDPRTNHSLVIEVDHYGNTLKQVDIAYGRKPGHAVLDERDRSLQEQSLTTYTENLFTMVKDDSDNYLLPKSCQSSTFQLYGLKNEEGAERFTLGQFTRNNFALLQHAPRIPFEQQEQDNVVMCRLFQKSRTIYRSNDLSQFLPLGQIDSMSLVGETYDLCFTPGLVNSIYQRRREDNKFEQFLINPSEIMGGKDGSTGGYTDIDGDGNWWIPSGRVYFNSETSTPEKELEEGRKHFFQTRRHQNPFGTASYMNYDKHDLLPTLTKDATGNKFESLNDYRVLKPFLITDPNGNRTHGQFDELGLPVGLAVMGKVDEHLGDSLEGFQTVVSQEQIDEFFRDPKGPLSIELLGHATSRVIYDFGRFQRGGPMNRKPIYEATISRESHSSELAPPTVKTQITFSYYDGFGRRIQEKSQAEPQKHPDRGKACNWIGSGWTMFNNKGNPVRKFEPFFDESHDFVFDHRHGVSPFLFYDPLGRIVATLHPNHSWTKSVFDSWHHREYDCNDTVSMDPKSDTTAGQFMKLLPEIEYLPTWLDARQNGQMGREECSAAQKTVAHADTPTLAFLDPLGRTTIQYADNGEQGKYRTELTHDIQGNQRRVKDAKDRIIMQYDHDLLGNVIHRVSMEAGERWILNNVMGNQLYRWDTRENRVRTRYDALQRPIESFLQETRKSEKEFMIERTVYGESIENPEDRNLRLKNVELYDQAGVVANLEYDFKGNLLCSERQLAKEYKAKLDWASDVPMEPSKYCHRMVYDTLNRLIETTTPDNSRVSYTFNASGLVSNIETNVAGAAIATTIIKNIFYNARQQRTQIDFGNGTMTTYAYDPLTFRLTGLKTIRDPRLFPDDCKKRYPEGWTGCQIQNQRYTYDSVGNITHIKDEAQQSIFFRNQRIDPCNDYTYDATYRLIAASGREHIGLAKSQNHHPSSLDPKSRLEHPHDGKAMARYVEQYIYDGVGNFLSVQHEGSDPSNPGWTRHYEYNELSQIEPSKQSNRLSRTRIGQTSLDYEYYGNSGLHGNITKMRNLPLMQWDYNDQLKASSQQSVGEGVPETTWYVYDSAGARVRKVTERHSSTSETQTRGKESLYFGDYEIFRTYDKSDNAIQQRETLRITNDDRPIALVERSSGDSETPVQLMRYQLEDHLGSVSLELDEHGYIISYEEYTPYGTTSYLGITGLQTPKRYRYAAKERDTENNLYYFGARYYDPAMGRWINCDPLGLEDGVNVYVYVGCNPVNMVDPTGTMKKRRWDVGPGASTPSTSTSSHITSAVTTPTPAPAPTPTPTPTPTAIASTATTATTTTTTSSTSSSTPSSSSTGSSGSGRVSRWGPAVPQPTPITQVPTHQLSTLPTPPPTPTPSVSSSSSSSSLPSSSSSSTTPQTAKYRVISSSSSSSSSSTPSGKLITSGSSPWRLHWEGGDIQFHTASATRIEQAIGERAVERHVNAMLAAGKLPPTLTGVTILAVAHHVSPRTPAEGHHWTLAFSINELGIEPQDGSTFHVHMGLEAFFQDLTERVKANNSGSNRKRIMYEVRGAKAAALEDLKRKGGKKK